MSYRSPQASCRYQPPSSLRGDGVDRRPVSEVRRCHRICDRCRARWGGARVDYEGKGAWIDHDPGTTWRHPWYPATEEFPVSVVSWNDAVQFCNWLSIEEHLRPCYQPHATDGWTFPPTATAIDCRPRPSGNSPAERERRRISHLATIRSSWGGMTGTGQSSSEPPSPSQKSCPTLLGCMISWKRLGTVPRPVLRGLLRCVTTHGSARTGGWG